MSRLPGSHDLRVDSSGWVQAARRCDSPNFGCRPEGEAISLAVIHCISLPPGQYGGDAIEHLFTNRLNWDEHPYYQEIRGTEVSAHFLVRRDGELVQFVSCDHRAWHAGISSWNGRSNCNDFSVGIELEGSEGEFFEPIQYAVLVSVLKALAQSYPLEGVVGHEHVAPVRKNDPGPGFDWPCLMAQLGWSRRYFPGSV